MPSYLRNIIWLLTVVFGFSSSKSQSLKQMSIADFVSVLDEVNNNLSKAKSLEVSFQQKLTNLNSGKVEYQGSGFFKRKDSTRLHSYMMGVEIIQNNSYRLVIDSSNKTVLIANSESLSPVSDLLVAKQSINRIGGLEVFKGQDSLGNKVYMAIYPKSNSSELRSIKFILDKKGLIKRVETIMATKVESKEVMVMNAIDYTSYKLNSRIPNSSFSIDDYVKISKHTVVLKPKYLAFQLINLIRR